MTYSLAENSELEVKGLPDSFSYEIDDFVDPSGAIAGEKLLDSAFVGGSDNVLYYLVVFDIRGFNKEEYALEHGQKLLGYVSTARINSPHLRSFYCGTGMPIVALVADNSLAIKLMTNERFEHLRFALARQSDDRVVVDLESVIDSSSLSRLIRQSAERTRERRV